MKFSVITCTWNSEPWLSESIASVTAQDYLDVERIFVDGGSTDGTLERIKSVKGDVKLIEGVQGGVSKAMNAGAEIATGDIISHLHSDDFYLGTDVLAKVATAFAKQDAAWLYGRSKTVISGDVTENTFVTKPYSWETLIRGNVVPHAATFVRRPAFREIGAFDTSLRYAMDYDLWLRLGRRGAPIQLPDYLAAFRFHANSISTRHARAMHREEWKVRMRHAGVGYGEWFELLARHSVRKVRLAMRPKSQGGFRP